MSHDAPSPLRAPSPPLTDGVVTLRLPEERDVSRLVEGCNDPEVPRWTTVPTPYREEDARAFLSGVARGWEEGNAAVFAITQAGDDRLDGVIALNWVAPAIAVTGYWAGPWARGRGVTSRALELLCGWGFSAAGLTRIDLATLPGNRASERVAQKCGFTGGEIVKYGFEHNGQRRDVRVWTRRATPQDG